MFRSKIFIVAIALITSCCGQKKSNKSQIESNPLLGEIHNVVDSLMNNLPRPYDDFVYTATHQRKNGKDYIKVATTEYFNKDSVSSYEIYKQRLLVFYSKDFFKEQFEELNIKGLENYNGFAYKEETISFDNPRYEVFEILGTNKFRVLSMEEHHQKKLFYFDDRYVPEPEPNDSLKEVSNNQNK